ncbi:peptidoglycan DD-metalloendopeptidase family protein [Flavobacteriaceae bacterium MHTCC 0001]
MHSQKRNVIFLFFVALFIGNGILYAQNNKQKQLETRRQELRREIEKINELRSENKSKEKSQLSLIEDFNYKISVLSNLIKVTNQQANLLTREINSNLKQIDDLQDELKLLKEDYAAMVVKSYKTRNQQSRIMFLLSSDNFKQAYKRLQYMKQYANHQKEQGEAIKAKRLELQQINKELLAKQKDKKALVDGNKKTQGSLEKERAQHRSIMTSIRKNLNRYASQIRAKQREADRIDREIQRILRAEIAKANKKVGKSTSSVSFALTPKEKTLANSFESNKGKLPWPVERGRVSLGYGKQPSSIDKSLTIQSNGVRITTTKGAKVLAVFNGTVSRILRIKNANPAVVIRHGNYLTIYKNLGKVYVKEGQAITTKQQIGEVFTNPTSGETVLSFVVMKNLNTQNPSSWIYKM